MCSEHKAHALPNVEQLQTSLEAIHRISTFYIIVDTIEIHDSPIFHSSMAGNAARQMPVYLKQMAFIIQILNAAILSPTTTDSNYFICYWKVFSYATTCLLYHIRPVNELFHDLYL